MTHQPGIYVPLRALFLVFFYRIFFILAGNEKNHNRSNEFDRTKDKGWQLPLCVWKNPHRLIMGKYCDHSSSFIFN